MPASATHTRRDATDERHSIASSRSLTTMARVRGGGGRSPTCGESATPVPSSCAGYGDGEGGERRWRRGRSCGLRVVWTDAR